MLNHITIMGRIVRDPELRRTGTGIAVTSFTVAVDRDFGNKDGGERETDFIDCVAWRQTGEFVSKYFGKGRMIVVSGRLQIRNWTDKDGNKRRTAEVVADNVYFGDSKRDSNNTSNYNGNNNQNSYDNAQGAFGGNSYQNTPALPNDGGFGGYGGYGTYGGYTAPTNPQSDFAMLEDDDAQLPF